MAVSERGEVLGSLSGGCVEADVHAVAGQVLETGEPELLHYGVGDATALAVGLTCGGEIEVFVERVDDDGFAEFDQVLDRIERDQPVALATWVSGADRGRHLLLDSTTPAGAEPSDVASTLHGLLGTSGARLDRARARPCDRCPTSWCSCSRWRRLAG